MAESNGGRGGDYDYRQRSVEEHLGDVRERLSNLEGRVDESDKRLATKEDVANAKFHLMAAGTAAGVAALSGLGTLALFLIRLID